MKFKLDDIDFVFAAIEDVWDNTPSVEDLPKNAQGWRRNGNIISKSSGHTSVEVDVIGKTVAIYQNFLADTVSNRDRTTL